MSNKQRVYRIGQIVPSSNTTMETEIPALLNAQASVSGDRFSFHSARMRMKTVEKSELEAMDAQSDRCATELSDARMDVLGYACLVAIMSMGPSYHRVSQKRLEGVVAGNGAPAPVITSAGALVQGLEVLGAKRVALVAPYMKPLTQMVVDYIEHEGIRVTDWHALEVPDNLEVGRLDPTRLPDIVAGLDCRDVDAIVLSACVQMPSLPAIRQVEEQTGKPVITAAVATAYYMLKSLGLSTEIPGAGTLLSGRY